MSCRPLFLPVFLIAVAAAASGANFPVTTTTDGGAGSLRDAITSANGNPGLDTISFAIPGAGVHTITPATAFPFVTDAVIIDGYSQPGSSPNTDPIATNAVLRIVLDGSLTTGQDAIHLTAGGCTVQGLVVIHWNSGITTFGPGGAVIRGNFAGVDPTGTVAHGNLSIGIVAGAPGDRVGGTAPADRNLASGNGSGIAGEAQDVVIQGNLVGTDATGSHAIPNADGILVNNSNPTIGGPAPGAGNVISGNTNSGLVVGQAISNAIVFGNRIGTTADGTQPLGNGDGILLSASASGISIGGLSPGDSNVIAFNRGAGVYLNGNGGDRNRFRGNSIHDNGGLGIDIGNPGPQPNDPSDADLGVNGLQNFPIIQSVSIAAGSVTIHGKFDSMPATTFDLDFYSSPSCARFPRDLAEGETFLGSLPVTTDGGGHATIDVALPVSVAAGSRISATATDPAGNTSEFSQRIVFFVNPAFGPSSGGTAIDVAGTDFANPTSLTIGGVSASSAFGNDHTLTAVSPALPAGRAQDVVAVTPDGTTGTLPRGWVVDFLDVAAGNPFHDFVNKLIGDGITAGCTTGNYCPNDAVTRAQMAVFLLRSKNGLCFFPPPATGTVFADVPANGFAASFIEALAAAGVTSGCGSGNYCPTSAVTRAQMAVFLLRTLEGPTYLPPPCSTATFGDVPCSSGFAPWVYELVRRNITAGCGGGNYCPDNAVTRGQMSVFLTVTFSLP